MFLNNPLRPGSVTTDILEDGAVTCVKTSFGSCVLPVSDVTLTGNITGGTLKPSTVLAVTYGGTGTATPALVAGTAISITGSWPNQTIANTSAYASLADPLPVAHGGTGTATPALVAGTAISITGTWPNQTISLVNNPSISSIALTINVPNTINTLLVAGFNGLTTNRSIVFQQILDVNTSNQFVFLNGGLGSSSSVGAPTFTSQFAGSFALESDDNNFYILAAPQGTNITPTTAITINTSGNTTIHSLAVTQKITSYNGSSTTGVGIPSIVAVVDLTAQTANINFTTIYTPPSAGMYRISGHLFLNNTSGSTDNAQVQIKYTTNGVVFTITSFIVISNTTAKAANDAVIVIYCDASTAIQYQTITTLGSGDKYDVHLRVEPI